MDDLNIIKQILGHPLRPRIIALVSQAENGTSPNEMSKALKQPLGNVSYHVRLLVDAGVLRLVRTAPRRGAVEHYYAVDRKGLARARRAAATAIEWMEQV